ncbi:MAG: ERAP1-like C-terminal domain-containing protein, partial [Acidimicrobiia bacterium]
AFAGFVAEVVMPLTDRLGPTARPDDSDLTRRLRGQALAMLGSLGQDADIIAWAQATVTDYLESGAGTDAELLTAALAVVASRGGAETHAEFLERYRVSDNPQEQLRFLRALTGFDDAALGRELIAATYDGRIRNQDGSWVQASLMSNREAGGELWAEVRRRWDDAVATFPPMTFRRLVEGLPALSHPHIAADVKAFFAETPLPMANRALAQNIELMDVNVAARARETQAVGAWLKTRA